MTTTDTRGGLHLAGVHMRFPDGTEVLDDINLDIAPGEMVCLVGASGCGKSTILRLASGLLETSAGQIMSHGTLGYVFQDATLMPWRTLLGNVSYLMELGGVPRAERKQRAQQAISRVNLTGLEKHYPRQLSGGMKMRASIARSMTLEPEVFLFDEPFGALDELSRERLNDELIAVFMRARFAGVFVTHSIAEAVYLGTRVVVMSPRPGRVVAEVAVPFDYPRTEELRYSAEFAAVCAEVSDALRAVSA
ncbi:ABC transporter ATP-binding protein [soil metagenome]